MPATWSAQKIHFLTQPELRALFRVITRKRDRALFLVAYRHGLRASEVGLLQVDDLNLAQHRLTVRRVKRSLPGIYPLRADEVTALKAYLRERKSHAPALFLSQRGTPISRRQLDTLMKHYGELADIPAAKRHFHALKHSIATHLLDAGADLRFVQD
jgi:site-specific recombinase XerD